MAYLIHNLIKIKLSSLGYLPDKPYHLFSDSEMCDAFLNEDENKSCFFYDNYPCIDDSLKNKYDELVSCLKYHLSKLKSSKNPEYILPNWVYSYMLGSVISVYSPDIDKHDLFVLMGLDNIDDEFNTNICESCYNISKQWLSRLPHNHFEKDHRAPTLFGEPHVIKYLRLLSSTSEVK